MRAPPKDNCSSALATISVVIIGLVVAAAIAGSATFFFSVKSPNIVTSITSAITSTNNIQQTISVSTTGHVFNTTKESTLTSTSNIISSSTSTRSTISSSTTNTSFVLSDVVTTWKNYLGNFSEISVEYNESGQANSTFSYQIIGHPIINSTSLTEVDLVAATSGSFSQSSLIGYFDSQGNATMITEGGYNYTGSVASEATVEFASAFEVGFFSGETLAILGASTNLGSSIQNFGPTQLDVTSYSYNEISQSGDTSDIHIGNLPGTNLSLLTYYAIWSGTNQLVGFKLLSLTSA